MSRTKFLRPAAMALIVSAAVAVAQPPDQADDAPPAAPQATPGSAGSSAPAAAGSAGTSSRPGRSPSDYRASEQISEDLPVSFPGDI